MDMNAFENYLIGVPKADEEHRHIFELINEVIKLSKQEMKNDAENTLLELSNFLAVHLHSEEEMMEMIHFPFIEFHKKEHINLSKSLIKMIENFHSYCHSGVVNYFSKVMISHIDSLDSQYGPYYKKWMEENKRVS